MVGERKLPCSCIAVLVLCSFGGTPLQAETQQGKDPKQDGRSSWPELCWDDLTYRPNTRIRVRTYAIRSAVLGTERGSQYSSYVSTVLVFFLRVHESTRQYISCHHISELYAPRTRTAV